MPSDAELAKILADCPRALTHHPARRPKDALAELAEYAPPETRADTYGEGELLAAFEARLAELLGKEAAVFMPSGTMAQQIALRIWSERTGCATIGFHPTCHLEIHEQKAYAFLHGLRGLPIGSAGGLMQVADVQKLAEPLAALIVELPQREIGGQLPAWDELVELCDAGRSHGAKLHLDGARLWEAQPFYERSHAEIAALFDTVYVSFYKGLGAIAGAALAGDAATIAEARVWQHRHGGRLISLYPLALSAQRGLELRLERMPRYRNAARAIAAELAGIEGLRLWPAVPPTNMFHVFLPGERDALVSRVLAIARERGIATARRLTPAAVPGYMKWEFVAGDATLDFAPGDVAALVRELAATPHPAGV